MTDFDFVVRDNIVERINQMDEFELNIALRAIQKHMCQLQDNKEEILCNAYCKHCPWNDHVTCLAIKEYLKREHITF